MNIVLRKTNIVGGKVSIGDFPVLILGLLIIISNVPIWARNVPNLLFYGLVLLFSFCIISVVGKLAPEKIKAISWLGFYFLLLLAYKLLSVSSAELAYYSTTVKFFFFFLTMLITAEHLTRRQKLFLVAVILMSMLFTLFDNIRLFRQYGASVFVHLFQWERFTTNSVNTTYVSSILFLSGILFVVFLHTKKPLLKIGTVLFIAFNLLFIARIAQRMIILGLAIFMLPLIALFHQKNTGKRLLITLFIIIALLLLFANFIPVIDLLDRIVHSPRLHLRFEQIKVFLLTKTTEEDGTMAARLELHLQSVKTWFSSVGHFLFGAGDHRETNEIIGNHSDYIDDCARYGLLGMLIWLPMTWSMMRQILSCSGVRRKTPLMRQMLVILLIFVLNAIVSSVYEATVGIQIFILMPVIFSLIQEKEDSRRSGFINSVEGNT